MDKIIDNKIFCLDVMFSILYLSNKRNKAKIIATSPEYCLNSAEYEIKGRLMAKIKLAKRIEILFFNTFRLNL